MKRSGMLVVKWEQDSAVTTISVVDRGIADLPVEVKKMLAGSLLQNLASTGDLQVLLG